eukprot:285059_1
MRYGIHDQLYTDLTEYHTGCKNYQQCVTSCENSGKRLSTKEEILNFLPGPLGGDSWTPVLDQENNWLQIGGDGWPYGLLHTEIAGGAYGIPSWSTQIGTLPHKKVFYCTGPSTIISN